MTEKNNLFKINIEQGSDTKGINNEKNEYSEYKEHSAVVHHCALIRKH